MAEGLHSGWETAGVVFVVDDLAGWLVGLLADAGRKKLTTLVLGDAQERALQQAASAAVQDTAGLLLRGDRFTSRTLRESLIVATGDDSAEVLNYPAKGANDGLPGRRWTDHGNDDGVRGLSGRRLAPTATPKTRVPVLGSAELGL